MAIVGGGGQAELAVVHERVLMPVPERLSLARGRAACPRSSPPPTTRSSPRRGCSPASTCSSTAAPAASGTAAIQLGARGRGARDRDGAQRGAARRGGRARRRGDRARGLRRARPVRRDPRAGRRAQPGRQRQRAGDRRPDRRDRDRRRRQGRAQPRRADGQARPDPRLDAARPAARGEGAHRAGDGALGAAAARIGRGRACRSPPPTRSSRPSEAYERFAAGGKLGKIVLDDEADEVALAQPGPRRPSFLEPAGTTSAAWIEHSAGPPDSSDRLQLAARSAWRRTPRSDRPSCSSVALLRDPSASRGRPQWRLRLSTAAGRRTTRRAPGTPPRTRAWRSPRRAPRRCSARTAPRSTASAAGARPACARSSRAQRQRRGR